MNKTAQTMWGLKSKFTGLIDEAYLEYEGAEKYIGKFHTIVKLEVTEKEKI